MSRTALLRDSHDARRCGRFRSTRKSERLILTALAPDQIALAIAAMGESGRARYDAERARRQYDAVEPENRLVARSLEWVWEEKLRRTEQIEQEYDAWRREQGSFDCRHRREQILALGQNLPALWHAATTTAADRKQIVRLDHQGGRAG